MSTRKRLGKEFRALTEEVARLRWDNAQLREENIRLKARVAEQITTLKKQFAVEEVVFVGDRGVVKAKGKAALGAEQWKYITALTNAQIRTLLKQGVLQPDLFDTEISEVEHHGQRLILRRNEAIRSREQGRREDKLSRLRDRLAQRNVFVQAHRRANPKAVF